MFYSDSMLTKKGPLANIWLAAHWDKKLSKAQIVQTDINESVNDILNGSIESMALRLSGQLLLGVSKIYDRKARYLLEDASDAVFRIKTAFKPGAQVDLPADQSKAAVSAITLGTTLNIDDLVMPELDLNLDEILKEATLQQQSNKSTNMLVKSDLKKTLALGTSAHDESGMKGFGPVEGFAELPGELKMDLEFGRRLTEEARLSEPLSIEQGRRESGVRESDRFDPIQFSPLRTPTKEGAAVDPFLQDDNMAPMMDDDYGFMGPDATTEMNPENLPGSDNYAPLSPVAEKIEVKQAKQPAKAKKRGGLPVDEKTEITNNELQANLRDNSVICEDVNVDAPTSDFNKVASLFDLPIFSAASTNESMFSALFKAHQVSVAPATRNRRGRRIQEEETPVAQQSNENMGPMMDDDYGFMAPDATDYPAAATDDAENQRTDFNNTVAPSAESPMKQRLSIASQASGSQATLSRSTLDTLEIWRAEFTRAKSRFLSLEGDLMQAMAGGEGQLANKRVAASAFFETLVLRGKGMIQVKQERPFAPINVQAHATLYTATSTD